MSNKNATIVANGNGEMILEGLSFNVRVDKVVIRGNGAANVNVEDQDHHAHHADDRNAQANRQAQAQIRRQQDRNAQANRQANEAVLKALEAISEQLSNLANRHL